MHTDVINCCKSDKSMTYHVYLKETYEWILNIFWFHLLSQADSPHYSGRDQCTCQPWSDMYCTDMTLGLSHCHTIAWTELILCDSHTYYSANELKIAVLHMCLLEYLHKVVSTVNLYWMCHTSNNHNELMFHIEPKWEGCHAWVPMNLRSCQYSSTGHFGYSTICLRHCRLQVKKWMGN